MECLISKGFKYLVALFVILSCVSVRAMAKEPSDTAKQGNRITEKGNTTKNETFDTNDEMMSNEPKKVSSKESGSAKGQKTDYTYEDDKISVKAVFENADDMSDQAELRVKKIPQTTITYAKYQKALNKEKHFSSHLLLYDISFVLDGKEIEPAKGSVKVSMSFKDKQLLDDLHVNSANDLKVIHFKNNDMNKQETLKASTNVKKGTTSFVTKSFSTFAVTNGPYSLSEKGWVTNVTIDKKENNEWKAVDASTTFKDGDAARISISYQIPGNSIQGNGSVVTYQIPNGIKVSSEQSGQVLEDPDDPSSTSYGTYKITTDGKITITFNDKYDNDVKYTGNVTFEGKIDKSKAGDSGKITFPGSSTSITISKDDTPEESQTDIKMAKSSTFSDDKKSITYTVTASTTKGTAGTVDIKDQFSWYQNVNVNYDQSRMKVVKVDSKGNSTNVSCSPTFGYNQYNSNQPYFEIKDLPKLNAGESYVVTYKANLDEKANTDGDIYVDNAVRGTSGNDYSDASSRQHMERMINKYGYISGNNIQWVVSLNDDHRDLKKNGYIFKDQLPNGLKLTDDIRVFYYNEQNKPVEVTALETAKKDASEINVDFSKVDDSLKNKAFVIYYSTNAPTIPKGTNKVSVSNTGEFHGGGHSYESTGNVDVTTKEISINKQASGTPRVSNKTATCTWNVTMGLTGESITGFTYKDIIKNAKDKDDESDAGNNSHYAIAKKLYDLFNTKDVLVLKGNGNQNQESTYVAGQDYTWTLVCYDKDDKVIDNNDESALVKSFEIKVKPKSGTTFKPTNLTFYYNTYGDLSGLKEGKTFVFENTGKIVEHNGSTVTDKESTATQEYKYYKKIEKLASESGNPTTYSNNNLNVDLKNTKGIINYRILVTIDKNQCGDFTVTDELPEGMTFDKDSVKFHFYNNDYDLQDSNWNQSYRNSLGFENRHYYLSVDKPTVNETQKDGKTELSFTFKDGYEFDNADKCIIAIDYKGVVANDPDWNDVNKTEKSYTNTAKWGENSSSQTTKVDRPIEKVSKSVKRLQANGFNTNTLEYAVEINPTGSDLIPNSDVLTLKDKLTVGDGVQAYLNLQNIALYKCDYSKENHRGAKLDSSLYKVQYNSNTHEITAELPDETPCVFVYQYTINTGKLATGSTNISNVANVNGEYSKPTSTDFSINSSSASLSGQKVTLEKVDADNNTKLLEGATFSIEKRENGNWISQNAKDVSSNETLTTGKDGKLSFTGLDYNTLYRIQEISAPEYYRLSKKYYYIMQSNATMTDSLINELYNGLDSEVKKDISIDNIHFFGKGTGKFYVPNTSTRLTVNKSWVHKDGTSSDPGESQVKMTLKRYIKSGSNLTKTDLSEKFILSSENKWTKTWDNLKADDGEGHEYVYKVEEETVDGYEAIYRGNDVNHGTINVINRGEKKTILPSTGGTGTMMLYMIGTLLSILGVVYIVLKKGKGGFFRDKKNL